MDKQNNNQGERRLLHPVVITINLLIILLLGNAIHLGGETQAADGAPAEAVPVVSTVGDGPKVLVDEAYGVKCQTDITSYGDIEFSKYKNFMEANFKNKSSTSSLLDLGIARYDKFKGDMYDKLNELTIGQIASAAGRGTTGIVGGGLEQCQAIADKYIDDASKLLNGRAVSTSNIKKTSVFVEKYKAINDKLSILNGDIMRMVVNMSSFEQKVPCYIKTCV